MVGVQMRLDHGWWMGPWVMVQYSVHVVPLFDHPVIWSSHYFDIPYMSSCNYVVLFHVVPLFDHPIHLSHYLPILSFISPTSSHYYIVILSFILLLFQHPMDVLLEMKGCKNFTGMKISFQTGQHVYQYSSSCGFTYLTSSMRFCPDNQWFRAGHIENIPNVRAQIMGQLHHRTTDTMQWEKMTRQIALNTWRTGQMTGWPNNRMT